MLTTKAWAKSLGISPATKAPAVADFTKAYPRSAEAIALRALALQGVVAVASGVDSAPIIEWFRAEKIWKATTPDEKRFLRMRSWTDKEGLPFRCHQEAEWALLWMIGKVESLGLPTKPCDTKRMMGEIIPPLGSSIEGFVAGAILRKPGLLLAEDDRTYNLWCYAQKARKKNELPADLNLSVLYERRYAFEWLNGPEKWDDVTCDA